MYYMLLMCRHCWEPSWIIISFNPHNHPQKVGTIITYFHRWGIWDLEKLNSSWPSNDLNPVGLEDLLLAEGRGGSCLVAAGCEVGDFSLSSGAYAEDILFILECLAPQQILEDQHKQAKNVRKQKATSQVMSHRLAGEGVLPVKRKIWGIHQLGLTKVKGRKGGALLLFLHTWALHKQN